MKMLILKTCLALIALIVLALPSLASAANEPELTYPTGTRRAINTKIKGKNVGEMRMTFNLALLACPASEVTGTLKKNNGTEVEAEIETVVSSGTGFEKSCTNPQSGTMRWTFNSATNGVPWCLRSNPLMAADVVQIRGGRCSEAARPIRIVEDTGCTYERTTPLSGTLKTDPEDALVSFQEQEFTASVGCLFGSSMKLDVTWTLETDEGVSAPMYFS